MPEYANFLSRSSKEATFNVPTIIFWIRMAHTNNLMVSLTNFVSVPWQLVNNPDEQ